MKSDKTDSRPFGQESDERLTNGKPREILNTNIGDSIDVLVEYLLDNEVRGIHPLIMGEVEKRLLIKVLERSRGNKLQAAKWLGMSRNTFHRKIQRLEELLELTDTEPEA